MLNVSWFGRHMLGVLAGNMSKQMVFNKPYKAIVFYMMCLNVSACFCLCSKLIESISNKCVVMIPKDSSTEDAWHLQELPK